MGNGPQAWIVSAKERQAPIRKAAYWHYLRRGGAAGQDLHDWLAAEAEVDAMLGQSSEVGKLARNATWGGRALAAMHRHDPAFIRELANRVFGDPAKAQAWLRRPRVQLGGRAPLAVLDSEDGARRVEELLTQIDDDDRLKID